LALKLLLQLLGLEHSILTVRHSLLHEELLTLLFNDVGAVERLKLLGEVAEKGCLLFISKALILVALLDLLLALFDASPELSCIIIQLLLKITLASKHLIVVAELVLQLVLERVLQRLLLKLNVSQTALLLLLLASLVLLERLLVGECLVVDHGEVAEDILAELALLHGHLLTIVNLLGSMLLFELLAQRGLLLLVRILDLEINVTEKVLL